jgi:hypothetical protein
MEKEMTKIAKALGRVMMTAVSLPTRSQREAHLLRWAQVEYPKDPHYAYYCLMNKLPMKF